MKAAILIEQNQPLVIEDIKLPKKMEKGQVLVSVMATSICGSQLGEIDGVKGPDKFLPHLLGHEGGGVVEEIGPGVTKVKKGDHVVMHWRKGAGIESTTPKYKWGDKTVNAGWVTTFNEKAIISENRLTPIPKDIEFDVAALMGCAVSTGFGVVRNNAKLKAGESIAVFGTGGVGLNVIQAASLIGASTIIAVDIYDHKLKLAKVLGATHIINGSKSDVLDEISEILKGKGADVAVDITGNVKVIEQAYDATSPKGRTILVGVPRKGEKVSIYTLPLHFGKVLTGSHGGESDPSKDIPEFVRLYKEKKLILKDLISGTFKLDDINKAIDVMRRGAAIKCMIRMA